MAKLFSGLTLVVALAAIFFGLQSKDLVGKLQGAAEREHTDRLAAVEKEKKVSKELVGAKEDLVTAKDDAAKAKADQTKAEEEATKAKGELTAASEAKTTAETQYNALKKTYDEFVEKLGGKKPEELLKSLADAETAVKDAQAKAEKAEKDVAELKTVNDTLSSQKKDFDDRLATQKKVIDRYKKGTMEKGIRGSVLAVNSGWGFCVLSIGDRQGAAANKVLVVARGGQAIGRVRITNVEMSQSVADIIPSSFTRGTYVQPGDDVIFTGEDKVREEPAESGGKNPATPATAPGVPALPQL